MPAKGRQDRSLPAPHLTGSRIWARRGALSIGLMLGSRAACVQLINNLTDQLFLLSCEVSESVSASASAERIGV